MTDAIKDAEFTAWATEYFGEGVSYPEACFDAWQAALRAQPAGWLPIESAPKDGTLLLLWESYEDEPFIGRWHDFRSRWIASTAHYNTDGDACVIDTVCSEGVTHWMPLPPPPAIGETK